MSATINGGSQANTHGSTGYVYLLATVAALGGLLFGYDTAVISGAIGFLQERFQLTSMWKGAAVSCALVGCMMGAASAGFLSDRFGRRTALLVSAVLFTISALGSAIPRNLVEFIIARVIGGIGVGVAAMLSPLYIAEVAPARIRGRLVSLNQLTIVGGMLVVYYVNSLVAGFGNEEWNIASGWRWMFGSETLPAFIFFAALFFVPESPRWLAKQGRDNEALDVLIRVGGEAHANSEFEEIKSTIAQESASITQLFQPGFRTAMIVGICLAILQQITGINAVLYYAPEIFKSAGMMAGDAINDTVIVGAVNLLLTIVAIAIVDKLGRKPLLLIASAGMGLSLTFLGIAFLRRSFEGPWVLLFTLTYVASFAVAMGPVVWVVISEIFPTRVRGRAMSISTVCLWVACFAVSQFFPVMLEKLQGSVFFVYALMCVVSFLFVALFVPETKGKTLEEIERSWRHEH